MSATACIAAIANRSGLARSRRVAAALPISSPRATGGGAPASRLGAAGLALAAVLALALSIGAAGASAAAPTLTIEPASEIGVTTAKVKGSVDPEAKYTSWHFEYVTQNQFENEGEWTFATQDVFGEGEGDDPVAAEGVINLAPATTYHLRLVASNEDGSSEAVAATFETDPLTAPVLTAEPVEAADVGYTTAHLEATIDPEGGNQNPASGGVTPIDWQLQYWQASGEYWEYISGEQINGAAAESEDPITVEADATGLDHNTPYIFRILAFYVGGELEALSSDPAFTTKEVTVPVLSTPVVIAVEARSATVEASVDPGNADPAFNANYRFEYSTDEASWTSFAEGTVEGAGPQAVSAEATGLQPNKHYFVRIAASNLGGEAISEAPNPGFTTDPAAPDVSTGPALVLEGSEARKLTGTVNPNNLPTRYWFEYGTADCSANPCTSVPVAHDASAGSGGEPVAVQRLINAPEPATTYHYRLVAENSAGTAPGEDLTFTTPQAGQGGASSGLPDNRVYEMVSPPDKHGGDVVAESQRTRAAFDGNAASFMTLTAFGDAVGTGVATEYLSQRSNDPEPGDNGWATHAITPPQEGPSFASILSQLEGRYVGQFSPDLTSGVFFSINPVTDDFGVDAVANLYRRSDLRTPGPGAYELLSRCLLCESTETALPPLPIFGNDTMIPYFAGASADTGHVLFESRLNLTLDSPAYPSGCNPAVMSIRCRTRLYEWDNGTLRIAGILPDGTVADVAYAAQSAGALGSPFGNPFRSPHTVSDGSDGHSRIFFTQPTNAAGLTSSEVPASQQNNLNSQRGGKLFVRIDHTSTDQINESERDESSPDPYAPAFFQDASADGTQAFFTSAQALTDDAPTGGGRKLYSYDASRPGSAPDNLTFISRDDEPGDTGEALGVIGASADGSAVYMVVSGQLVDGAPLLGNDPGIYLWHEGDVDFIGSVRSNSGLFEILSVGGNKLTPYQARVSPDGRTLVFSATDGSGLTGYDHSAGHGECNRGGGEGCTEIYVYRAETDTLSCASCNPSGAPATASAMTTVQENRGGAKTLWRENHALSDDGSRVFFSTAEALVPDDANGRVDAYQYDTDSGSLHLLSTGRSTSDSWFLDASADGSDAFFVTREQLVGWDLDTGYDLYDARVDGGFPEPTQSAPPCSADACQGQPALAPQAARNGTADLITTGNIKSTRGKGKRCPRGKRKVHSHGRARCVDRKAKRKANEKRRAGR